MCSVQYLREFIKERLTAVCEEIFSEVQKTIVQYEEEIDRQRRLLDISRKPDTNSHITVPRALPQQHDCEEEEGLEEQQVCNQERDSCLVQEDPEPPQIKEEQEEVCSSREGEQLGVKQEADWTDEERLRLLETIWKPEIMLHRIDLQQQHVCEEQLLTEQQVCNQERSSSVDHKDPEPPEIKEEQQELCSNQEGEQLGLKQEIDTLVDNGAVSESQSQTDTKRRSAQCDTCGKTLQNKYNLTTHQRVHTGEKPYCCDTCGKRFIQKSDLERHVRTHTGEKPFPCSTCGKRFIQTSELQRHVRIHTGEKPYCCNTCGKRFADLSGVMNHMRVHTGEKPYSCSTCGKKFSRKWHLERHSRVHSDLSQQLDSEDEEILMEQEVFNQERSSSLHQEDAKPSQIKEEQEELCSSQEGEQLGLKQETDTFRVTRTYKESDHSELEPNSEQPFSHSSPEAESQDHAESQYVDSGSTRSGEPKNRRHHRKRRNSQRAEDAPVSESPSETDTRKKSLQCDTCGKTFDFKSHLIIHMRVHTGEKPYSCNICGKRFSWKSALKTHVRSCTGEKPFCCSICGKRFIQKSHLERHVRIHTGEKPYPCTTCGKRFNQKSELERHIRIHTGEKPHCCNTCGKRFADSSGIIKHMRFHTGEKPYSCSTCGKKFSQPSGLKIHVRIHTGEKPHSCSTCGKRFNQSTHLKKHMRIHTG